MEIPKDTQNEAEREVTENQKKPYAGCLLALFAGLTMLLVAGFASFYFFVTKPALDHGEEWGSRFGDALSGVFGTEVNVRGSTAVLEKSEIGELALVQRKIQAITKYETTWLGSENLLIVRGDFLVKAGFDLSEGGQWEILEGRVNGALPQGKVLSVEPIGPLEVYYSEHGLINYLSPEDQASAFNYLIRQARLDAEMSDICNEAEKTLIRRINDRMGETMGDGLDWQSLP
jgi:hypothetical protein